MDPLYVQAALAAGSAAVGGGLTALVNWRLRGAQTALTEAQADQVRQAIYQELTKDLRAEMERLRAELVAAKAEADHLRRLVAELESRLSSVSAAEQRLGADLAATQAERDQLRIQLSAKEATIAALQRELGDAKTQLATLQGAVQHQGSNGGG